MQNSGRGCAGNVTRKTALSFGRIIDTLFQVCRICIYRNALEWGRVKRMKYEMGEEEGRR